MRVSESGERAALSNERLALARAVLER